MFRRVLEIAILTVAYVVTARFGLTMDAVAGFATLVWPPSGISLAALLLFGTRLWPGVFLGAVTANLLTGADPLTAFGIGCGNTMAAVTGTLWLERAEFHKSLDRMRDVFALFFLGCLASTMISASVGVLSLWLGGLVDFTKMAFTWRAWWVGDGLGVLLLAPVLLTVAHCKWRWPGRTLVLEAAVFTAAAAVLSMAVFGGMAERLGFDYQPLPFVLIPLMVWSGLRFGMLGATLAAVLIACFALWGTMHGLGPFTSDALHVKLLQFDLFVGVATMTALILASATSEALARESKLKLTENQLRMALDARDEFLSIASHELRTPLSSLSLQLQMTDRSLHLDHEVPSMDVLAKSVTNSLRQVTSLTHLVDDLLDVSRIQTGRFTLNCRRFNLSALIQAVGERMQNQLDAAKCKLELKVEAGLLVRWDSNRTEQVLVNLLTNAIKYAPGQPVCIEAAREGANIRLAVEDSGPGIPVEEHSRLFARFERASKDRRISGMGLGLYVVKQIVSAHNGTIQLDSGNGRGAKFSITMPVQV